MQNESKLLRIVAFSFALIVLSCLSTAQGQSGRRAPKSKTVIAPIPGTEPTPSPSPSTHDSKPVVRFTLTMDQYDSFSSVSLNAISGIRRSCVQRLSERTWVAVSASQRATPRSDAIKLAKAEKDSYVIWLRVREDTMSSRQTGTANNAFIEYTVFALGTAAIITSGSTYPASRNNNVILGRRTSDIDGDYYLNKAARDTADKILSKFSSIAPRPAPLL